MPISWRLTGDRNVAAFYRGEANRLLFHLDQIFIDLPFGVLNRTMPDGSLISVLKLLGDRIVFIEGAGIQKAPQAIPLEAFYIMVYWSPTNIKFYTASFDPARISEYTQDLHPDIKVAYASQSDLLILNDSLNGSDPQKHIVNLGPTRDNWLRILGIGANIYSDRFWYRRFISGSLTGNIWFPYRQIDSFSKNDTAYSAYLPKVDSDNNIFWTEIYHNSYGLYADVRGPDNYTLAINDQKEEYAADWQGRIHQSGYGMFSVIRLTR